VSVAGAVSVISGSSGCGSSSHRNIPGLSRPIGTTMCQADLGLRGLHQCGAHNGLLQGVAAGEEPFSAFWRRMYLFVPGTRAPDGGRGPT
jgi:hypothetical protein